MEEREYLTETQVAEIRGKNSVKHATQDDVELLLDHIWMVENVLLTECDGEDFFGTEGWRHYVGID